MKRRMNGIGTKIVVLCFVFSMALCIAAIPALADPSPVVSVSPASQTVGPEDSFSIDIIVDPDGEWLSAGQLYFAFNVSVMQVDSVTAGDLFGANYNVVGPFVDNTAGTVEYSIARQGATTEPTPTGTFATITLTVNEDAPGGTYALDITDIGLLDENFAEIVGIVINDGSVTVEEDVTPPTYSNIEVSPASPTTYAPGKTYTFNITVQDNVAVDTVLFEFDGVNYTDFAHANSVFSYELTDLAADTYNYRWYMNDTSDNWNSTSSQSYIINESANRWDINEDCTVNYIDLTILSAHWDEVTTPPYPRYDINEDGTVNYIDLTILSAHWGETTC